MFVGCLVRTKMMTELEIKVKKKKVGMMVPYTVFVTFSEPSQLEVFRK